MKSDIQRFDHGGRFPATRLSAVNSLKSADPTAREGAIDLIARIYWRPTYAYLRHKWKKDLEGAKDLTQGFFLHMLESNFFSDYDPLRARFRTYLRTCIDRYVMNDTRASTAVKRGGDTIIERMDFSEAESVLAGGHNVFSRPDYIFEKEWVRTLFMDACDELEQVCRKRQKPICYTLFLDYDIHNSGTNETVTYQALGLKYGLPESQVTNYLAYARKEFRQIILKNLRQITANEQEFREEAQIVLGIKV